MWGWWYHSQIQIPPDYLGRTHKPRHLSLTPHRSQTTPPLPQPVQPNPITVFMHHVQLLPCLDALQSPALLCPLQNGGQGKGHPGMWLWWGSIQMSLKSPSQWLPTVGLPLQGALSTHDAHLPRLHPVLIPVPLVSAQPCATSAIPKRCPKSHTTTFLYHLTLY